MPYRRGGFALTPPSIPVFVIALILAVIALLVHYAHVAIPLVTAARAFDVLAVAFIIMLVGVLFRGV
jgi:hypothetical protein